MKRFITVTGKGWVNITPDITRVTITHEMVLPDYNRAFQTSTENYKKIQNCLKTYKLDLSTLRTLLLKIDKYYEYEYDEYHNRKKVYKGYKLIQKICIDLEMNNHVLTELIKSIGAAIQEDIEIEIGYTVGDTRPANLRMLEEAVKDATEKAEVIAKSANYALNGIYSINYSDSTSDIYFHAHHIHADNKALSSLENNLKITPYDISASKEVKISWHLKRLDSKKLEVLNVTQMAEKFNLERFVKAQDRIYTQALEEIKNGHKKSHWVWYIYPQLKGFGHSYNSEYYGISNADEAKAYLAHPILGPRLREMTEALIALSSNGNNIPATEVFNTIDAKKVKSCMTLFEYVSQEAIFGKVLQLMYNNQRDNLTLYKLR